MKCMTAHNWISQLPGTPDGVYTGAAAYAPVNTESGFTAIHGLML